MGAQPSGTVTFMFTDIVGSTRLWDNEPATMALALVAHDELVDRVVSARHGYVFSGGGDGFGIAFARADDAVRAAVALQLAVGAQNWPLTRPLQIRIGLHAGAADERRNDYFGPAVNAAARVMGYADGGQIVASNLVAKLAGRVDGVVFSEAGRYELRGGLGANRPGAPGIARAREPTTPVQPACGEVLATTVDGFCGPHR